MEELSDLSLHLLSGFFVGLLFLRHNTLEIDLCRNHVSSGDDVIVVDNLNERLDLGSSLDFLLAHFFGYSQCVPFNASY